MWPVQISKQRRRRQQQLQQHGRALLKRVEQRQRWAWQATNRSDLHDGSFHVAISPVLVIAQCFGLMPVCGVRAATSRGLSFSRRSWRTWYSLLYIGAISFDALFAVNFALHGGLDMRSVEPIVFNGSILWASYQFLQLARQWPQLMRRWARVESHLPPYASRKEREQLARRIHSVASVLLSLSLMEHLLSIISAVYHKVCPLRQDPVESYLYAVAVQFFHVFPYSNWLGWLGKLLNVLLTFGWNYIDLFVILVSIGLSHLLTRLTRQLQQLVERPMPEKFWTYVRTRYRSIVELIYDVDDAISGITFISFGSNVYFICLQLLKSINEMPSTMHAVYFYFSLAFLIGRSLSVLLFVSAVHERARDPLRLLQLVPPSGYLSEVQRLANELSSDNVSLSGLRFFNVTRKLCLTVAGSIVTYELVLIQFHEDEKSWDCQAGKQ
ncbi:gustatory receptor 5a for trehalose [Drosophila mojavensis]|uniref:Gustatory receptor n=1 Tax=Drosophila mojavensis TaxID=7230 RepID=B4L638_DROMO|nr:gustatory receptor 5a for trehalose [Drosophila mojavensis]EDW05834.1 uncharacterized protein Dmoj_GI16250 [Drosophila mojavensis]